MVIQQMEWNDAPRDPDVVSQKNLASGNTASGRGHLNLSRVKGSLLFPPTCLRWIVLVFDRAIMAWYTRDVTPGPWVEILLDSQEGASTSIYDKGTSYGSTATYLHRDHSRSRCGR